MSGFFCTKPNISPLKTALPAIKARTPRKIPIPSTITVIAIAARLAIFFQSRFFWPFFGAPLPECLDGDKSRLLLISRKDSSISLRTPLFGAEVIGCGGNCCWRRTDTVCPISPKLTAGFFWLSTGALRAGVFRGTKPSIARFTISMYYKGF